MASRQSLVTAAIYSVLTLRFAYSLYLISDDDIAFFPVDADHPPPTAAISRGDMPLGFVTASERVIRRLFEHEQRASARITPLLAPAGKR